MEGQGPLSNGATGLPQDHHNHWATPPSVHPDVEPLAGSSLSTPRHLTGTASRHKMVSEVGWSSNRSDSQQWLNSDTRGDLRVESVAATLAGMRDTSQLSAPKPAEIQFNPRHGLAAQGPLSPWQAGVTAWDDADRLYRNREARLTNQRTSMAKQIDSSKSETNGVQCATSSAGTAVDSAHLADMMSHLCETMDAFRQALSSGVVASPSVMSLPPRQNQLVQNNHASPQQYVESSEVEGVLPFAAPSISSRQVDQTKNSEFCPPKKDVMKPQMFDGKEPINSFLAHFEVCAQFNHWTPRKKVAWLQWSLKGRAQQILWDLPSAQLTCYDDIVKTLRQRFGSEHQSEVHKLQLRNRRRAIKRV